MESYLELKRRQEVEIADFPMFFAFNNEQLAEGKKQLEISDNSLLMQTRYGGIMRKVDYPNYQEMVQRHAKELRDLMTFRCFAVKAFMYEMNNLEYYLNEDREMLLSYLGLEENDLVTNPELQSAFVEARQKYSDNFEKQNVW